MKSLRDELREAAQLTSAAVRLHVELARLTAKLGWIIASELIADWRQR